LTGGTEGFFACPPQAGFAQNDDRVIFRSSLSVVETSRRSAVLLIPGHRSARLKDTQMNNKERAIGILLVIGGVLLLLAGWNLPQPPARLAH
jgi:hypothetical protein